MKKISNYPQDRYLLTDELISDEGIEACKKETLSRSIKTRSVFFEENKDLLSKYINWKRKSHEVALLTLYAFDNLEIPIKFNCLFNYYNPKEYTISELTVTQSIFEGFYPINTIDIGHKHILICKFEEGKIPSIINQLQISNDKFSGISLKRFKIGICDLADFDLISQRINTIKKLKEKYGIKWYEYDDPI